MDTHQDDEATRLEERFAAEPVPTMHLDAAAVLAGGQRRRRRRRAQLAGVGSLVAATAVAAVAIGLGNPGGSAQPAPPAGPSSPSSTAQADPSEKVETRASGPDGQDYLFTYFASPDGDEVNGATYDVDKPFEAIDIQPLEADGRSFLTVFGMRHYGATTPMWVPLERKVAIVFTGRSVDDVTLSRPADYTPPARVEIQGSELTAWIFVGDEIVDASDPAVALSYDAQGSPRYHAVETTETEPKPVSAVRLSTERELLWGRDMDLLLVADGGSTASVRPSERDGSLPTIVTGESDRRSGFAAVIVEGAEPAEVEFTVTGSPARSVTVPGTVTRMGDDWAVWADLDAFDIADDLVSVTIDGTTHDLS